MLNLFNKFIYIFKNNMFIIIKNSKIKSNNNIT